MIYPLVIEQFAIEHGHRNSEFSHQKIVIFHSFFVCLPEGTPPRFGGVSEMGKRTIRGEISREELCIALHKKRDSIT